MKTLKIIGFVFLAGMLFWGCDLGNESGTPSKKPDGGTPNTGNDDPKKPHKADLTNAKALYIENNQDYVLYKIVTTGETAPVSFTDDGGKAIQIYVGEIYKKSRNYFTMDLFTGYNEKGEIEKWYNVLVEINTGRIFDLGILDIRYGVSEIMGKHAVVYNSWDSREYDTKAGTVYLLDLDTLTATPLNNPEYDHIYGYFWYFEGERNAVFAIPQKDDTIIVCDNFYNGGIKLDLKSNNPPQKYSDNTIYGYPLNTGNPFYNGLPIFSNNASFYSFMPDGKDLEVTIDGVVAETLTGFNISGDNVILNTPVHFAYDFDDLYIYKSGYLSVSMNDTDGSLDYTYTAKDLSFLFEDEARYYYKNGIVYCLNGNTFKKADPLSDSAYTTIYSSPATATVKKSWMEYEDIYFSAYKSATNISTYRISKGESSPVEISNSEMAIRNVVELTF
jgi:hypothetical protein